MIATFMRRSITTWMMMTGLVILGFIGFKEMPVELSPPIDFPIVTATYTYPGAAPEEMENSILKDQIGSLFTLSDVKKITSQAYLGIGYISIEFLSGVNTDAKTIDVSNTINANRDNLPTDLQPVVVKKYDPTAQPILNLSVQDPKMSGQELYRYADRDLRSLLAKVSGVSTITISGGDQREIQVELNPFLMKQYYVTLTDVLNIIQSTHVQVSSGNIYGQEQNISVRFYGELNTDTFKTATVTTAEGRSIPLSSIAVIKDGVVKKTTKALVNDAETLVVNVIKTTEGNDVQISKEIKKILATEKFPADMKLRIAQDSSDYTIQSTRDTLIDIFLGVLLTMACLFIFTGEPGTTWIAFVQIMITLMGTFFFMAVAGFSLNSMTFLALGTAMGPMIANTLIAINFILSMPKKGSPFQIALDGINRATTQIFAANGTHLAVFIPMVFMKDIIGQYLHQFGLTVIFATIVSMFVSFILTPVMMQGLLKKQLSPYSKKTSKGRFKTGLSLLVNDIKRLVVRIFTLRPFRILGSIILKIKPVARAVAFIQLFLKTMVLPRLKQWSTLAYWHDLSHRLNDAILSNYKVIFESLMRHRKRVIIAGVASMLFGFFIFSLIGGEFVATSDQGRVTVAYYLPANAPLEKTQAVAQNIETLLRKNKEVQTILTTLGGNGTQNGNLTVILTPSSARSKTDLQLIDEWTATLAKIPDVSINLYRTGSSSSNGSVYVTLYGMTTDQLLPLKAQVDKIMLDSQLFRSLDSSYRTPSIENRFIPDQKKMTSYGITNTAVANALRIGLYGDESLRYKSEGEIYKIRIQMDPYFSQDASIYDWLTVSSPQGLVPISDLGDIVPAPMPSQISGRSIYETIDCIGYVGSESTGAAVKQLTPLLDKIQFPKGTGYFFGGSSERQGDSMAQMGQAFLLALLFVYIILAATMNSLLHPLTVCLSIFVSFSGAFIFMFLIGASINISSLLALLMLIGLVVNDSILILEGVEEHVRKHPESDLKEALWEHGAKAKMRINLMITASAVLSMLPQLLSSDSGRAAMGAVIVGGVLASMFVAFTMTPVLFFEFETIYRRRQLAKQARLVNKKKS